MRSLRPYFMVLLLVCGSWLLYAHSSEAGINLPFKSTFNCADWTQNGTSITCDGMQNAHVYNYCTDSTGNVPALINSTGNFANGGGGKGFRTPIGDGQNVSGGNPYVILNTPQPEVWIRYYSRYAYGFTWNPLGYHKLIYISQVAGGDSAIVDMYNGGTNSEVSLYIQSWGGVWHHPDHRYETSDPSYVVPNWGWYQIMNGVGTGTPVGDGKWHYYESHFKINSAPGVKDGIYQQWVDGRLVNNHRDVEWNASPFTEFAFGTNQSTPANGRCTYVDWDDFAIVATTPSGRDAQGNPMIGPVGAVTTTTTKPNPPSQLTAK